MNVANTRPNPPTGVNVTRNGSVASVNPCNHSTPADGPPSNFSVKVLPTPGSEATEMSPSRSCADMSWA